MSMPLAPSSRRTETGTLASRISRSGRRRRPGPGHQGRPGSGSLLPDAALAAFAALVGADNVVTIPGAPHAPQRTHPAETTAAILRALG